jgi:hypothetical protein
MNFKDYVRGIAPQWTPDEKYKILEDVETGKGLSIRTRGRSVLAMIPFCVYSYISRYKHRFGISDTPELKEVYPFVTLIYDNGDFVDPKTEEIILPSHIIKDDRRLLDVAFRHINSKFNHYKWLTRLDQDKVYLLCQDKAEEDLRDNPGDVELHPHDPDYDDN